MRSTRRRASSRWLAVLLLAAACGGGSGGGGGEPGPLLVLGPGIDTIIVEVDYMQGAEPYTGTAGVLPDIWRIFGDNIDRIFENTGKVLVYPTTLSGMEELTGLAGPTFNAQQVLEIARANRDQPSGSSVASYYIVFLDGVYEEEGQPLTNVLGISLTGLNIIAVFKPVVEATGTGVTPRVVEQTVMVHEFGHGIGLVNNGLPLTSDHHDIDHGAHCTNVDCVMYFANEGSGLQDLVDAVEQTGSGVLFGQECLDDTDAITGNTSSAAVLVAVRAGGAGLACSCSPDGAVTRVARRP